MINTSTAYRENVNKEFAQKWHAKGTITFADSRTYDFDDHDFWESGIKIQDSTSRMDVFEVGQAAIGQLTITFQNFDGRFDSYDFSRARFQIYIGMKLPNETIEWINKGVFTVDSPVVTGSIMVISLSNNMAKFDKDYDSTISFPCTLGDLLLDACTRCGVMLGTPEFFNSDYVVDEKPNVDTMTYRDMVSYIAQLAGCWARINNLGQLVLDWYDLDRFYPESGDTVDGNDALTASGNPAMFDAYPDTLIRRLNVTGNTSQTVTHQGKNLFPSFTFPTTWNGLTFNKNSDGSYTINGTATSSAGFSSNNTVFPLTPMLDSAKTYTLSVANALPNRVYLSLENIERTMINGTKASPQNQYMTFSDLSGYRKPYFWVDAGATFNNYVLAIQLEVGSSATSYEQFVPESPSPDYPAPITGVSKVTVNGTDYSLPQTLYSLPNETVDSYDAVSGQGMQNVGKVVLNGTESWGISNLNYVDADTGERNCEFSLIVPSALNLIGLCSHVPYRPNYGNREKAIILNSTLYFQIHARRLSDASLDAFKSYLAAQSAAGTPVTVLYELATPATITGTPVSITASTNTTVSCDNGGTVEVTYSGPDVLSGGDFTDYDQPDTVFGGVFRQNLPAPPEITFVRSESVATHDLYITGVRIIKDKAAYFKGKNDFVVTIKDNPLVQGDVDTLVSRLACKLIGFTFRPMEISALGDPSIEAGDVVWATTTKGRYATIVSNLTYSIVDYETFSADAESEAENQSEYYSEAAKIVQEAVRNTEKQIAKTNEISEMSRLILGIYSTKQILDDGSEIEYMHDKPKLEDSRVIWKRTGAGIFLSLDGGKTYDDGVDSNGNAKFNQLWAMLIYANQIICGGSGVNGKFTVKDESDNDMLILDNRGITMQNGAKLIGGNGVLSMFISESNGDYWQNGYSDIGYVDWENGGNQPLHHTVYVPENFHIVSAIAVVEIMSMHILVDSSDPSPLVPEGWYTASNVQLLASTDTVNMYLEGYWASDVFDIPINAEPVSEFGTWNPPASSEIQKKQVDVSQYLIPGKETMFTVTAGKTPRDSSMPIDQGLAKLRVIIIGYKS